MEEDHGDLIPPDFTTAQYYFQLKTGKSTGSCIVCKKPTKWNSSTDKYFRFCDNPACKKAYREEFKKRMITNYGKVHLLNDPSIQKKMLANRSISGEYIWSDGTKKTYVGSYEKSLLEFLDKVMDYESSDVEFPSPHVYKYIVDGVEHFYIPDGFIHSIKSELEIKDGGTNPNTHPHNDRIKEKAKDQVLCSNGQFNYCKITDKRNFVFLTFLDALKVAYSEAPRGKDQAYLINMLESERVEKSIMREGIEVNINNDDVMSLIAESNIAFDEITRINKKEVK